jgi:hypothetical protein
MSVDSRKKRKPESTEDETKHKIEQVQNKVTQLFQDRHWADGHELIYVREGEAGTDIGELFILDPCQLEKINPTKYEDHPLTTRICTGGDGAFDVWAVYDFHPSDNLAHEYRIVINGDRTELYETHSLTELELQEFFDLCFAKKAKS